MVAEGVHALQALLLEKGTKVSISHLKLRSHLRGHHTLQLVCRESRLLSLRRKGTAQAVSDA